MEGILPNVEVSLKQDADSVRTSQCLGDPRVGPIPRRFDLVSKPEVPKWCDTSVPSNSEDRGESMASVTSLLLWEKSVLCRVKLVPNALEFRQKEPDVVGVLHDEYVLPVVLDGLRGPVEGAGDQHLPVHHGELVVHVAEVLVVPHLDACKTEGSLHRAPQPGSSSRARLRAAANLTLCDLVGKGQHVTWAGGGG